MSQESSRRTSIIVRHENGKAVISDRFGPITPGDTSTMQLVFGELYQLLRDFRNVFREAATRELLAQEIRDDGKDQVLARLGAGCYRKVDVVTEIVHALDERASLPPPVIKERPSKEKQQERETCAAVEIGTQFADYCLGRKRLLRSFARSAKPEAPLEAQEAVDEAETAKQPEASSARKWLRIAAAVPE